YRPGFLSAIDACLRVRHSERPRSVAQLRPLMLGRKPQQRSGRRLVEAFKTPTRPPFPPKSPRLPDQPVPTRRTAPPQPGLRWWPINAAALLAVLGGAYGGYQYSHWEPADPIEARRSAEAAAVKKKADADHAREEAKKRAEEERVRKEAEAAAEGEAGGGGEGPRQRRRGKR